MHKALFLDRDGIVNVDTGYVHKSSEFEFTSEIFTLCQTFQDAGYKIIVVTNQSGIARGMYSEDDFHVLTEWMTKQFAEHDIEISGVYYCPHHAEKGVDKYRIECDCRKPEPGMLLRAMLEHDISAEGSVMVGDRLSDMQASRAAGLSRHILFVEPDNRYIGDADIPEFVSVTDSLARIKP